jgi:hypothetical protein
MLLRMSTLQQTSTILFHNTMRVADGHLEPFKRAIREAVAFVEEHGPQLLVHVSIDEEQMRAHSFQLYADSDAMRRHWELSDPYIEEVMRHCTVEQFDVYGEPDEAVMNGLRAFAATGVPMTTTPVFVDFTRLASSGRKAVS